MKLNKIRLEILSIIGRLLRLQGSVSTCQLKRRAIEIFGERDYVKNECQKTLRELVDSGVLSRIATGIYERSELKLERRPELLSLIMGDRSVIQKSELVCHPVWMLFDFDIDLAATFHEFNLGVNDGHLEKKA